MRVSQLIFNEGKETMLHDFPKKFADHLMKFGLDLGWHVSMNLPRVNSVTLAILPITVLISCVNLFTLGKLFNACMLSIRTSTIWSKTVLKRSELIS